MSELITFEIQYYDTDKSGWITQSGGNDKISTVMELWNSWTSRYPKFQWRLVLKVTKEIILDERG